MLQMAGASMVFDQRPESLLMGFAITARATGRDLLAHMTKTGRAIPEIAITDPDFIDQISRFHTGFDRTGGPNLFFQDSVNMLSVVQAVTWRGAPLIAERVSLHSRIPWRNGRVFAFLRNPLAV